MGENEDLISVSKTLDIPELKEAKAEGLPASIAARVGEQSARKILCINSSALGKTW